EQCGLRFQVRCDASPMFANYVKNNKLADYVTGQIGERHAVREVTELLLASIGKYDDAVCSRTHFDEQYATYIAERNTITAREFIAVKRY
ncbi:MAG: hypothetical protein IKM98_13200, partial [Bacteroidales bacterium]|nr:hypothetical protein [Bacteroidales bacterium]